MVHGDYCIATSQPGRVEGRICWNGSDGINSIGTAAFDGRANQFIIFTAKVSVFTGVWVEAQNL